MPNNSIRQLNHFKQNIDKNLDIYFSLKKREFKKFSPSLVEMIEQIYQLCKKGKRIRAAFIYFSYLAYGGKQLGEILKLSSFIELTHTYFLIHDDIMDQDNIRRGVPTIHARYQQVYKKNYSKLKGNAEHFGYSMGIMAGDLTNTLAYDILTNSKIDGQIKNQILAKTNSLIINTLAGQIFDISQEIGGNVSRKNILNIYHHKTAQYTVESPLHIGAIAAGKNDKKTLATLSSYAIPLGIAFQIQDDILGIFGNEKKLGKPVGSDICEGKSTLLVWKACAKADKKQKKILDTCLGNEKLSKRQLNDFRQVIIDTGALAYAKKESDKLLEQSLKVITKADLLPKGKDFLVGIAEHLIKRDY